MYRAITVKADGIISGVHDSALPFVTGHFARNPELANDTVVPIPESGEYRTGLHILCYNKDGTRKPDLWCIQNGYMALPPNKEIVGGALVSKTITEEEAKPLMGDKLDQILQALNSLSERVGTLEKGAANGKDIRSH